MLSRIGLRVLLSRLGRRVAIVLAMTEQTPQSPSIPSSPEACPQDDSLTDAEVLRVARMARLELAEDQVEPLRAELARVLGWAAMLKAVDDEHMSDETRPPEARLDTDEPGMMLDHTVLETIAPQTDGPFIGVPKVLGGGGGA